MIKPKENAKYAMLVPTSMGVRLTPENRQPVHISSSFKMQATSAESNVASISAALGLPVKVLTAFVKGSPIAQFIKDDLAGRHMDVEAQEAEQGGPWGYRHQFNIADTGFGVRGPRVHNDRAGEVGRILDAGNFDLESIFGREGVQVLHMSGLVSALSPETGQFCTHLARAAKKYGTLISFDLNYRASFWKGREAKLREIFMEIASLSDVLVGNEEDFQLALGIQGPEAGGSDLSAKIESFKAMITRVKESFPGASVFATTLRQALSANSHMWGAIMLDNKDWYVVEPREIQVLDRIGGGDAFVGGMLYGLLKGMSAEDCLHFGWAAGALTVTMESDYLLPADEEQVWSAWLGNARVRR